MTKYDLLRDLKEWLEEKTKDRLYETDVQQGDGSKETTAPHIYRMRLPNSRHAMKYAPYLILQLITWSTKQAEGMRTEARATVRIIFCVHNEDEEEGALDLLNLMEFVERLLLRETYNGRSFYLDREAALDGLIYTDDTRPFYMGEMAATFVVRETERDVRRFLVEM